MQKVLGLLLCCGVNVKLSFGGVCFCRSGGAGQFGDEGYWFGSPGRHEREEFMGMGDKSNSASKQIYLTFPADSSFTDEDVSNYFGSPSKTQLHQKLLCVCII